MMKPELPATRGICVASFFCFRHWLDWRYRRRLPCLIDGNEGEIGRVRGELLARDQIFLRDAHANLKGGPEDSIHRGLKGNHIALLNRMVKIDLIN